MPKNPVEVLETLYGEKEGRKELIEAGKAIVEADEKMMRHAQKQCRIANDILLGNLSLEGILLFEKAGIQNREQLRGYLGFLSEICGYKTPQTTESWVEAEPEGIEYSFYFAHMLSATAPQGARIAGINAAGKPATMTQICSMLNFGYCDNPDPQLIMAMQFALLGERDEALRALQDLFAEAFKRNDSGLIRFIETEYFRMLS